MRRLSLLAALALLPFAALPSSVAAQARATAATAAASPAPLGYFRFPTLAGGSIVFTAEGDLWRVPLAGGVAERLTSHPAEESRGFVSPDGKTLAFSASYEGPTEVYTMSLDGGAPVRGTFEGGSALVVGWTPDGQVLYSTRRWSTLPNTQLARLDPRTGRTALVPLAQASEGTYDAGGRTLYFTRLPFQGSYTKRYKGGTAQNLWKFADGATEAVPLTADWPGTSKTPMLWKGRIYFLSDRDGTMNLWSMAEAGGDLRQHTHHTGFDAQSASLADGRIVYQLGADLHLYDIAADRDALVPVRLVSDFDQTRERWVKSPIEWVSSAHLSPTGDRIVFTARGQLFVAPAQQGRIAEVTRDKKARWREAFFMPDGKSLVALGDPSGEVEFWRLPANGIGAGAQLTDGATVLRWNGVPSPDGRWLAHYDKDLQLWLTDLRTKATKRLAVGRNGDFDDLEWSPDSRWLAYAAPADNDMSQLWLYDTQGGSATAVTTDRYESFSPAWSPDGKWLYFLSNRNLRSVVGGPWGTRQPEPFFDRQTRVYQVSLRPGERSPYQPDDELYVATPQPSAGADSLKAKVDSARMAAGRKGGAPKQGVAPAAPIAVDLAGIATRLMEVPMPPGNYRGLSVDGKRLYLLSSTTEVSPKWSLVTFAIDNKSPRPETFMEDVRGFELSMDRKKLLVRKGSDYYVMDAAPKAPTELAKSQVNLQGWTMHLDPRDEWRQMFADAWRLERDYFYDRGMHGVDWKAVRDRYAPLVERVTDRSELSDLLAQMVGELSALHIFVYGGDYRRGTDLVFPASLGATFARDDRAGGWRVSHMYQSDPDIPEELAPLARPNVNVREGDVITAVNGVPTLSVPDIGELLRGQADRQVLLRVRPASGTERDVVVVAASPDRDADLRYDEWEYTRRLAVERQGAGRIGYVHLRAMGGDNMAEWSREFYPVFNRDGLVIDVRHNRGGNIDSWVLEKLLRKAWTYWQPRAGNPTWNMQEAFRGHVVVLTDEYTASDGELFAEGFRRLGLGKLIGTRTWGGEIWLSSSNFLVDRGIATAAEMGVYAPDSGWVIEGHGVDPDIVVDNAPHATFEGKDAQLDAAIAYLQNEIRLHPIPVPPAPKYPNKSLQAVVGGGASTTTSPRPDER